MPSSTARPASYGPLRRRDPSAIIIPIMCSYVCPFGLSEEERTEPDVASISSDRRSKNKSIKLRQKLNRSTKRAVSTAYATPFKI